LNKTTATDRPTAIPDIEPADVYPEDAVAASAFVYVREKDGPLARPLALINSECNATSRDRFIVMALSRQSAKTTLGMPILIP